MFKLSTDASIGYFHVTLSDFKCKIQLYGIIYVGVNSTGIYFY